MNDRNQGYGRGWFRYGFDKLDFSDRRSHGGSVDIGVARAFSRGTGNAHVSYLIVSPDADSPQQGMHMHREDSNSEDAEQWYLIVDGHGVMRFTNGDSVEFEPGDLLVCYPATGHSLQATGDRPARMIAITPSFFGDSGRVIDVLPEKFEPRICVTSIDETKNPLTAACSVCSAKWERPESDRGANTLPTWSIEHACTQPFNPIHE